MRPCDERGIADDCDPPVSHHIRLQIVDGLHEHARHTGDDIGEHRWKHTVRLLLHGRDQFGPDKTWGHTRSSMNPIDSREHVPQLGTWRNGPIPHDIKSAMTGVYGSVGAGDRDSRSTPRPWES